MKNNRLVANSALIAVAVLALLVVNAKAQSVIQPQTVTQSSPAKPNEAAMLAKARAMFEAINQRARELGLVSIPDEEQAEFYQRRLEKQLREDFVKLYSVNREKLAALDYKGLSETTADLKDRATRLKYNVPLLMVTNKSEKPRYEKSPDQLPSMLSELARLLDSFFGSPIFRESSANDAERRAKAVQDLESIIVLSDTISKVAKGMKASAPGK